MCVDVLMITYNRPEYTERALKQLLETCDENARAWVWHNGRDERTLEVVNSFREHPAFFRFHHSPENVRLTKPTNWLWEHAEGELIGKVDDDCLVPDGWIETLLQAHRDEPKFGVLACWHFRPEDFQPRLAAKKINSFSDGHQVLQNPFVQGSGYLMKTRCVKDMGVLLKSNQQFQDYCLSLAEKGWINGWYFPLLFEDLMDDPRSDNTMMKTDADLLKYSPLAAQARGDRTLDDWLRGIKRNARIAQACSSNPLWHKGWRYKLHARANRIRRILGREILW